MSHPRNDIRTAAASAVSGVTSNVYVSRVYSQASMPSLTVWTPLDPVNEAAAICGRKTVRDLQLVIEARAKAAADVDDALDALCADTEAAIAGDSSLRALVHHLKYMGAEIELDDSLQQPAGLARMEWLAVYETGQTPPMFTNPSYTQGGTALAFFCNTSRSGKIRMRLQPTLGEGGDPLGDPIDDDWELVSKISNHGVLFDGLPSERWFTAYIKIDADIDPDLDTWTLFTDGVIGPHFQTGALDMDNPADPEVA